RGKLDLRRVGAEGAARKVAVPITTNYLGRRGILNVQGLACPAKEGPHFSLTTLDVEEDGYHHAGIAAQVCILAEVAGPVPEVIVPCRQPKTGFLHPDTQPKFTAGSEVRPGEKGLHRSEFL